MRDNCIIENNSIVMRLSKCIYNVFGMHFHISTYIYNYPGVYIYINEVYINK